MAIKGQHTSARGLEPGNPNHFQFNSEAHAAAQAEIRSKRQTEAVDKDKSKECIKKKNKQSEECGGMGGYKE